MPVRQDEGPVSDSSDSTVPEERVVAGNTSHTRPENRTVYPALDGLRAIAFLMVLFQHYLGLPWGWAGVDVFFVLSGFLITGILFDSRDDDHRVRNFYVRRTLRIFPLYYGVMFLILPFVYRGLSWSWLLWPAYLGNYLRMVAPYAPGAPLQRLADFQPVVYGFRGSPLTTIYLGHFWSLCVEEQFYLVWPWIVFWIRRRSTLLIVCGLSVPICLIARLVGQQMLPTWMLENQVLYRATPLRLDALLLGGFLALFIRGPYRDVLLRAAQIVGPFLLVPAFFAAITHVRGNAYPAWIFTWGLLVVDLTSALMIACMIQPGSVIYRLFSWRPLRFVGRISYGMYVFHDIPHGVYLRVALKLLPAHAAVASTLIAFVSTLLIAWLSYRFFETPFLNLKERWTIRSTRNASREPVTAA